MLRNKLHVHTVVTSLFDRNWTNVGEQNYKYKWSLQSHIVLKVQGSKFKVEFLPVAGMPLS